MNANLVVVGTKGLSGLKRFLIGSVSEKVMKCAPCSVLVVRQNARAAIPGSSLRIVLAFDDSKPAEHAARLLASLPRQDNVEVLVVTVQVFMTAFQMDLQEKQSPLWREQQRQAEADLERVAREIEQLTSHVTPRLLEGSDASGEILNVSGDFDADLIVLGATGQTGIERFLLGSVANRVLHHANCSVLVVRG